MRFALILPFLALPAWADVPTGLSGHILPGYAQLAEATATLSDAARADCAPEALRPSFHKAYDAWISVSHIQFGPLEDQALALYWWTDTPLYFHFSHCPVHP